MQNPVNKPIIAIDIDDVLAEHIEAFLEFTNKNYGTNMVAEDYLEQWSVLWNISRDEVEERALSFHVPETIGGFTVIEDAHYALNKLKADHDLVIVTARPQSTIDSTLKWVELNFPNIFSDVHFVPIWDPGPKATKAQICQKIGADYLIDDLIRHCNLAAEAGLKAILFKRIAWKQPEKIHPDVVVVKNWQEVLDYFDGQGR